MAFKFILLHGRIEMWNGAGINYILINDEKFLA